MKPAVTYVSTKGQIVIPAPIREEMDITPGTRIVIERKGDTILLRPVTDAFIRSFRGRFKGLGLEELREQTHRDDKAR